MIALILKYGNSEILKGRIITRTIQIRKKGSITILMQLQKRYRINEGDPLTKHYFSVRERNLAVLQPGEMLKKIRLILSHLESKNDS